MTLDEGIQKAEEYLGTLEKKYKMPVRGTVSAWVQEGVLSKSINRENLGPNGGARDIFPEWLFAEIVATVIIKDSFDHLKKIRKISNRILTEARNDAERILGWKEWTITDVIKLVNTIEYSIVSDFEKYATENRSAMNFIIRDQWLGIFLRALFGTKPSELVELYFLYQPDKDKFITSPVHCPGIGEEERLLRYSFQNAIENYLFFNPKSAGLVIDLLGGYEGLFNQTVIKSADWRE